MTTTIRCDIVSAEEEIFHGDVTMIVATGEMGELGIAPRHAPLISVGEPALEHSRRLEAVEGAVELDAVEATARVLEPAARREIGRIEVPAPAFVVVAGDADEGSARPGRIGHPEA